MSKLLQTEDSKIICDEYDRNLNDIANLLGEYSIICYYNFAETVTDKDFKDDTDKLTKIYNCWTYFAAAQTISQKRVRCINIESNLYVSKHFIRTVSNKIYRKLARKILLLDDYVDLKKFTLVLFGEELTNNGYWKLYTYIRRITEKWNIKEDPELVGLHRFKSEDIPVICSGTVDWVETEFSFKYVPSITTLLDKYLIADLADIIFTYC